MSKRVEARDVHIRGKSVEGFVQVIRLHDNARRDEDAEEVCRGAGELVVAGECELDGDAEALDRHDRDRADERAYGDVDGRVRAAVLGDDDIDHNETED